VLGVSVSLSEAEAHFLIFCINSWKLSSTLTYAPILARSSLWKIQAI
jgi:hypothetical protein